MSYFSTSISSTFQSQLFWSSRFCRTVLLQNVSFQHFNHSYFAAQDFAEQFFCKTYLFNISITAILQLKILQNSSFAKHFSLTVSDLYDSHLDDSGLEYTFWLQNISYANEEAIFPASPLFFSELNKGRPGLIWWLPTTLRPLIMLTVQNLMSLRNMQLQ